MTICPYCNLQNEMEQDFCSQCRYYIGPPRPFHLDVDKIKHPDDAEAIESLVAIPLFPSLVKQNIKRKYSQMRKTLLQGAIPVYNKNFPLLYNITAYCARVLGLKTLPEIYISPNKRLNAYTFGTSERPVIVVTHGSVRSMSNLEMEAVIGHEMGHIMCEHVVYQTLAQYVLSGLQFVTGSSLFLNIFTSALFKKWIRAAEISADRAGLLVTRNINKVRSAHLKLAGWRGKESLSEFFKIQKNREDRLESKLWELANNHPFTVKRLSQIEDFYRSQEYKDLAEKTEKNDTIYQVVKRQLNPNA
ncbi:M48 family metallopeptidase [[Eubacterium] cellulosolvens]